MTNYRESRLVSNYGTAHPTRRFTADDVYAATGITVVSHLALARSFYLTEVEGRWFAFVSSAQPEKHSEIFEVLMMVGPIPTSKNGSVATDSAATYYRLLSL